MRMRKTTAGRWSAGLAGSAMALVAALAPASGASAREGAVKDASCNWATATSVAACGGMSALIAAAQKEGVLNTITLPPTWANYGTLLKEFSSKYHIKYTDAIPDGSSQQELDAIVHEKGTSKAPDVVDVGTAFAIDGASEHLFAPYKVQEWNQIPANEKDANGDWYYDYGGYVSIGYDASAFTSPPTSFKSLLGSQFKGAVGLDGDPTQANAAFSAVFAASLANGGSFNNVVPGIQFFKQLASAGNFVTAQSDAATIGSGQIKVGIDWDYLNAAYAAQLQGKVDWKVIIPSDAHYASYYVQAVSKYAPDPAAARLWEEFLYSNEGQNGWLEGFARPVLLNNLIKDHAVNESALAKLPVVSGAAAFPSQAQQSAAKSIVVQQWPSVG
jgi:putative spermidine/putrescine transport system substrate-binding protein